MIDVVIVNWNSGNQLKECVEALLAGKTNSIKIFIYDNKSKDKSLKNIPIKKNIKIILGNKNVGFARACNNAASLGSAKYILFINPDVKIMFKSFNPLIKKFKDDPRIDLIGINLKNKESQSWRHCAYPLTPKRFLIFICQIYKLFIFRSQNLLMTDWNHASSRFVNHVTGAFYFIRRSTFTKLKGFDTNFFVYLEDLDLSRRIKNSGKKIFYMHKMQAIHSGGGCSCNNLFARFEYQITSRVYFAKKHFLKKYFFLVLIFSFLFEPFLRLTTFCLKREFSNIPLLLVSYIKILKRLKF